MKIRGFKSRDAGAVSELIVENLRTVNIRDYPEELIDALVACKNPQQVLKSAGKSDAFVAVENGRVLGVVMLYGNKVTDMFVHTQMQGKGIGRLLMAHIEEMAKERQFSSLVVDSSITAAGFYTKCGYRIIRRVNKPFCGIRNIVFEMIKMVN